MKVFQIIPLFIAPLIFLILSLLAKKSMERNEFRLFAGSFFFGMITVVPMIIVIFLINNYWLTTFTSLRRTIFYSFVMVGFVAEFVKFMVLRYYYIPKETITKPFDGILYSLMIAMGYATSVNIYYYFMWNLTPHTTAVIYVLPFANILIGILMGFFVGMAKFKTNSLDSFTGFSAAVFFHGFFIFNLISRDYLLLGLVSFGTLVIVIMLAFKSLNANIKTLV